MEYYEKTVNDNLPIIYSIKPAPSGFALAYAGVFYGSLSAVGRIEGSGTAFIACKIAVIIYLYAKKVLAILTTKKGELI